MLPTMTILPFTSSLILKRPTTQYESDECANRKGKEENKHEFGGFSSAEVGAVHVDVPKQVHLLGRILQSGKILDDPCDTDEFRYPLNEKAEKEKDKPAAVTKTSIFPNLSWIAWKVFLTAASSATLHP